jgi:hypothetical protein
MNTRQCSMRSPVEKQSANVVTPGDLKDTGDCPPSFYQGKMTSSDLLPPLIP